MKKQTKKASKKSSTKTKAKEISGRQSDFKAHKCLRMPTLKHRVEIIELKQQLVFIEETAREINMKLAKTLVKDVYWGKDDLQEIEAAKKFIKQIKG